MKGVIVKGNILTVKRKVVTLKWFQISKNEMYDFM